MSTPTPVTDDKVFLSRAIESSIRIGLILILVLWCFQIVRPFIVPIIWGIIIAVASSSGHDKLRTALGGRTGLSATLLTLVIFVLLVVPVIMLAGTLVETTQALSTDLSDGKLSIPSPPESVATYPVIGEPLQEFWMLASENLAAALSRIEPQLKAVAGWLLATAAGAGLGILQFAIAIIISGVLLAHREAGHRTAIAIGTRLVGERGPAIMDLAETTVRSVTRGILGVALIQSLLAGLGFLVMGIPGAGFWALIGLLLAVIQIGLMPVLIPIVIYVFSTAETLPAVVFLIWCVLVGLLDNVLKPILLGRGVKVPMVIIFVGAIGGFLAMGIIGLFIGSVILALGYTLFVAWVEESKLTEDETKPLVSG